MVTSLSIEHQPRHDGPWIGGLLLSLNAVGVAAYLWWASKTWPIPEEAGLCSQTMEPILWVVGCIPLFIGFAIINLGWWLVARWARSPEDTRKRWPARLRHR